MKHEAFCQRDWTSHGITWVIILRERTPGWVEVGAFLVDAWCLGIKDAYFTEEPRADFEAMLAEQIPEAEREAMDPACARKLVEGAVAYAQSLGFLPHRDFRKARKVLGKIDARACTQEFAFGHEGKPCFVAGPYDDETRINRVLSILSARLGTDGFTFIDEADDDDDGSEDELERDLAIDKLYHFITDGHCPNKALTELHAVGFVAAMHMLPDTLPPSAWVQAFWGGEDLAPVFSNGEVAGEVMRGLMELYNQVSDDLKTVTFAPPLPDPDDPDHVPWAAEFATGLLRGLNRDPATVKWLRGHPDASAVFELLDNLAGIDTSTLREAEPEGEALDYQDGLANAVAILFDLARELRSLPGR